MIGFNQIEFFDHTGSPQRWEPAIKRVAPLSGVNASIMKMKPSNGQSVELRSTSAWMSSTADPGRNARACSELSLKVRPTVRTAASSSGGYTYNGSNNGPRLTKSTTRVDVDPTRMSSPTAALTSAS